MRKLAEEFPEDQFVQQPVAQLPWGHVVFLMNMVADSKERISTLQNLLNTAGHATCW